MTETIQKIKKIAGSEKKICFVSGNFNIVHPGHLRLLRFASEQADILVVGVLSDNIGNAVIPEKLRLESLQATSWVDFAFILDIKPEEFIKLLKPSYVVKGKEHEKLFNSEKEAVDSYGGKLLFSSGDVAFSSIELLKNETKDEHFKYSTEYLERHSISNKTLINTIADFRKLNVLVIGEVIVDEYITCEAVGMSREDPTIVVSPLMTQQYLGAAGIVAAHAASLGANVNYFSVVGNDDSSVFVNEKLDEYGVYKHLFVDETRPTIRKQRFRSKNKNLLRVNYLHHHDISTDIQEALYFKILEIIDIIDLVIFSDFNYGCLPQEFVNKLIYVFKKKNIKIVADSQSSSQMGDVSRFKNTDILTPTEREARLALNDNNSGLIILAEKLREKSEAENIILTLGSEGIIIHSTDKNKWLTDKLPAFNRNPKDESGAGDSFLACSSMAYTLTNNIWISSYMGSIASSIQVSRLGNIPLTNKELDNKLINEN